MKKFTAMALGAFVAGAAIIPATAHAEGKDASMARTGGVEISSQSFSKLDTDRSGTLSESEYSQDTTAKVDFERADANSDGTLTLAEAQTLNAASKNTDSR